MAAVEQNIQYKSELHAGDAYEIRSKVLKVGERSVRMQHDMHKVRDGALAATTAIIGVHIDADTRRGVPLPDDVSDRAGFLNVSMLPSGAEQVARECGPKRLAASLPRILEQPTHNHKSEVRGDINEDREKSKPGRHCRLETNAGFLAAANAARAKPSASRARRRWCCCCP